MELRSRAIAGSTAALAGQLGRFGIQTVALLVLSRMLPVAEVGRYALAFTVIGAATIIGDFGFSQASIHNSSTTPRQKSNLFWLNIAISLSVSAAVVSLSPLIASFYGVQNLRWVVVAGSPVFVLVALGAQHRAELEAKFRFGKLAVADVLSQLCGLIVGITWAAVSPTAWAMAAQLLATAAMSTLLVTLGSGWSPYLPARGQGMRSLLSYGGNTTAGLVSNYVAGISDSIVVGHSDSAYVIGLYSRMYQLFTMPLQQLATPLTRVALPVLVEARRKGKAQLQHFLVRAQLVLCYLFLPIFAIFAVSPDHAIGLAFGSRYEAGSGILRMFAVGGMFQCLGYVYYWAFLTTGRMDIQFRLGLVTRSVAVGLIIASGPLGAQWTAAAAALGLILNWMLYSFWGVPRAGVSTKALLEAAIRPLIVSLVAAGTGHVVVQVVGITNDVARPLVDACSLLLTLCGACLARPSYRRDCLFLLGVVNLALSGVTGMPGKWRQRAPVAVPSNLTEGRVRGEQDTPTSPTAPSPTAPSPRHVGRSDRPA